MGRADMIVQIHQNAAVAKEPERKDIKMTFVKLLDKETKPQIYGASHINIIFIESNIENEGIAVDLVMDDGYKYLLHLLSGKISTNLMSMNNCDNPFNIIYKYLFICENTNRHAIFYCDSPIKSWRFSKWERDPSLPSIA